MKPTRRQVAQGTAWSAPVIVMGAPAALAAVSGDHLCVAPQLSITNYTRSTSNNNAGEPYGEHSSWSPVVTNLGSNCSLQVTQITATFTVISAPSNATWTVRFGGNGNGDFLSAPSASENAPVAVGDSLSVTRNATYAQFWVSAGASSTYELVNWSWWNAVDANVGMNGTGRVAVTYTLSGTFQDDTTWGPITVSFDNGGAGY